VLPLCETKKSRLIMALFPGTGAGPNMCIVALSCAIS
jgi:hypothetical protein